MSTTKNRHQQKDLSKNEQKLNNETNKILIVKEGPPSFSEIITGCMGMLTPAIGFSISLYLTRDLIVSTLVQFITICFTTIFATNLHKRSKSDKIVIDSEKLDWLHCLEIEFGKKARWNEGFSRGQKMFLISGVIGYYTLKDLIGLNIMTSGTWVFPLIN